MIFVIGGETASGKSSLAFKFAKAVKGIIINGDAFACYRELKLGTAKPTDEELSEVPSFLFNNISVSDKYSIFDYQRDGRKIIDEHLKANIPIIIVGGSGLYVRALLYDYNLRQEDVPPLIDDVTISNLALHERLKKLDPEAAQKIHMHNRKRVLRALAIINGQTEKKSVLDAKTSKTPLYPHVMIALTLDENERAKRIHERTVKMFKAGLKKEALELSARNDVNKQALQAIGYKEIITNSSASDEFLIDLISTRTRQLAKRQRTFWRHQFESVWFNNSSEAYTYLIAKYEEK